MQDMQSVSPSEVLRLHQMNDVGILGIPVDFRPLFGVVHTRIYIAASLLHEILSFSGNYIMFASATTGLKKNNNLFSPCSKVMIAAVLNSVKNEQHGHSDCFKGTVIIIYCEI